MVGDHFRSWRYQDLYRKAARQIHPGAVYCAGMERPRYQGEVARLSKKGVVFERIKELPQDDLGIWTPEGTGGVAWFKDPDGNTLSLTQFS